MSGIIFSDDGVFDELDEMLLESCALTMDAEQV